MTDNLQQSKTSSSSDPALTRKEFLEKALKGAILAGGIAAAPRVLDKFLIPPAYAAASSCNISDFGSTKVERNTTSGGPDAISGIPRDTLCTTGD